MQPSDPVYDAVCLHLADVLAVDLAEITPNSQFASDLAGESLDVIDLNFRLSKHFDVPIRLNELGQGAEFDERRILTPASLADLQQKSPFLDLAAWANCPILNPLDLLRVDVIVAYVRAVLARQQQPAEPANT